MPAPRRSSAELEILRERVRVRAGAQGGVFRRSDLAAWGLEPTAVLTMRRNGTWVRLHHGVYADRHVVEGAVTPQARHLLLAAAACAAIEGPVACFGVTAALLQGIPVDSRLLGHIELVRPIGRDSRALRRRISKPEHLPAATIHILDIDDADLTVHAGLPTAGRNLAAWTAAMAGDVDWGVVTLDAVAWQAPEVLAAIAEYSGRWTHLAGSGIARQALGHARTGSQSPLESLSRVRLVRAGMPEPRLQVPLHDARGLVGIVDMLFEAYGVVGEADGVEKYVRREDLVREKRREDRIRSLGFPVVRWDWSAAQGSMRGVADEIRRASAYSRVRRSS